MRMAAPGYTQKQKKIVKERRKIEVGSESESESEPEPEPEPVEINVIDDRSESILGFYSKKNLCLIWYKSIKIFNLKLIIKSIFFLFYSKIISGKIFYHFEQHWEMQMGSTDRWVRKNYSMILNIEKIC